MTPNHITLLKGKSNINGNFDKRHRFIRALSENMRQMARLERRPRNGREGSCSGSSGYTVLTSSLIENIYPNQTHQKDQFIHRKRNQNYNSDTVETSSDQLSQQGNENITRVP